MNQSQSRASCAHTWLRAIYVHNDQIPLTIIDIVSEVPLEENSSRQFRRIEILCAETVEFGTLGEVDLQNVDLIIVL